MQYTKLGSSSVEISRFMLGTWAFGGDEWWGPQDDRDSEAVMATAIAQGVTAWDTAPVYGKGHSEEVIGDFLGQRSIRTHVVIASKVGLTWNLLGRIGHDLRKERMLKEIDATRRRLKTDYLDLYQIHWPDPAVPVRDSALVMHDLYTQHLIRAVGVSNYSVEQMQEFLRYCPLHCLQVPYNMLRRDIERDIIPFCREKNIAVIVYVPLASGVLSGKFFCGEKIPGDICRRKHKELQRNTFQVNKTLIQGLRDISRTYDKTVAQLVLAWTVSQPGITAVIAGCRNQEQIEENVGGFGWNLSAGDRGRIEDLLSRREESLIGSMRKVR